ncbi:MAG: sensor histidine kinase, partial [Salinirussus sp.]
MGTLRTDGGFPLPTGSANGGIFDQVRPGWSLTPLRISLLYLVVGLVGLGLSDLALPRMVAEPLLSRIQALKGITEVVLTAGLIFLLTHTREVQLEADRERLTQQRQELEVIHRVLRHNIRNDINVILLGIESLRESVDDAGSEQIELLIDKIDELTRYTDRAATIREITSGAVDRKRFEVGELLDEAADVVRSDAATGSVSSTVPRSTAVYAHPMLDEALIELVENAIEHTVDEEPTVAIEVCSRMEET